MVEACSRVTHSHPLAIEGAQIIALATALSAGGQEALFDEEVARLATAWPWSVGWPASGPAGYVVHSVNAAISVWRESSDIAEAMERVVRLGGDTDTIGSMVGGIICAGVISPPVPAQWGRYYGWPSLREIEHLEETRNVPYLKLLASNLVALPLVLGHGLLRLLPPYRLIAEREVKTKKA